MLEILKYLGTLPLDQMLWILILSIIGLGVVVNGITNIVELITTRNK